MASRGGRPTKYRAIYATQAFKLCLLGATDKQIADFLGVSKTTVNTWKKEHPRFLASLKKGKEQADAQVAQSLYKRATGYEHRAVKIVADAKTGTEHIVPYTERYAPDTVACIFWLKNRQPDLWRDKVQTEHSGEVAMSGVLVAPGMAASPEDWAQGEAAPEDTGNGKGEPHADGS